MKNLNLSAEAVKSLVDNGVIRENYLQLVKGFNASFDVVDMKMRSTKSFVEDGTTFDMPVLTLHNPDNRFVIWGSTLFNALIIDAEAINVKPIDRAKGLPVYFRDEFLDEHPNLRKVSDLIDEDGGFTFQSTYTILGAIVTRSVIDDTRWSVGFKLYAKGSYFLEYERLFRGNDNLRWIPEERVHEIAALSKSERTFKSSTGDITLPSTKDLKIVGNADTDVRFASAQFLIKKQ